MNLQQINDKQKQEYNNLPTHVIQSWEWGDFRKNLGLPLKRYGLFVDNKKLSVVFQLTFHKIPFTKFFVGYLPKGPFPSHDLLKALLEIGKKNNCAFIKIEPNVILERAEQPIESNQKNAISSFQHDEVDKSFKLSPKPLFTKFNYVLDLNKSEEEILKNMHPKFRYNIKVAQKHKVVIEERIDEEAFNIYQKLYFDTTKRQGYLGHNQNYHQMVWQTFKKAALARILIAFYQPTDQTEREPLAAWMLFNFKDILYYPYGGSSEKYKNVMASNLIAWEAIKLGKKLHLKKFDLWGALGPAENPNHPWQGFHRFKTQLGAELVEYIGTYDLVFNWPVYYLFNLIDKFTSLKVLLLKLVNHS